MLTLYVRAPANPEIGLGHLYRCRNVALALINHFGGAVEWFVTTESVAYFEFLGIPGRRHVQPSGSDPANLQPMISILEQAHSPAVILLDGYDLTRAWVDRIRQCGLPIAVFDDGMLTESLNADVVINSGILASASDYQQWNTQCVLVGPRYAPLAPWFSRLKLPALEFRQRCVVTFGGADSLGLSESFLAAVAENPFFERMAIDFITGSGVRNIASIRNAIAGLGPTVRHLHQVANMAECFSNARLVISAAGGTAYEILACGVRPQLLIVSANQRANANALRDLGVADVFDATAPCFSWEPVFESCRMAWQTAEQTDPLRLQQICDGEGANRIAEVLQGLRPVL